jgi:hypothetical protein
MRLQEDPSKAGINGDWTPLRDESTVKIRAMTFGHQGKRRGLVDTL